MYHIRRAAVLGAGTMGAQIAAHFANAGLSVLLLDVDKATAARGLGRARKLRPGPFFTDATRNRISLGGFDTDLALLDDCDWITEAVVERLDVKQVLVGQVEAHRRADAIVSSNTSGIPIATIAEGRGEGFRRHWLGTHFFNPPRYLPLLEVIPTPDTDPAVVETISQFAGAALGKGVVVAKDTPNFIGNRIGLHGVTRALGLLANGTFTVEEIDAMSGPIIGRPKSATCRTMDIAGLDILADVAKNLAERLDGPDERAAFALPPLVGDLVTRGWVGEKSGQGLYRKERGPNGVRILTLDPSTMDYRERLAPRLAALDEARSIKSLPERLRALFLSPDRVGEFLRATLGGTLIYAAEVATQIAHSIDDIDRAMRWGFGWELGPFEIWDAIGVDEVLEVCGVTEPPALVRTLPQPRRFRAKRIVGPAGPEEQLLRQTKASSSVVAENAGASLVDLGDGVLAVEFHSKMNTIGADTLEMLNAGVSEAEKNFEALVVANEATNFSAGANLLLVLLEAQEENWDDIDRFVRRFQNAVLGLRDAAVPVIAAPAGLTLGGGCEITLHADRVQAAAETYMGLVEVGVGLIPAGGGTKELLARAVDAAAQNATDPLPLVRGAFELIGLGKVSTSGHDARRLGLLRDVDRVTMNRERVIADAKTLALHLARGGYQPVTRREAIKVGGPTVRSALELGVHLAWRGGHISGHDVTIGRMLAHILSGGNVPHATTVTEQHVLDLEREAFLSLCGEPKTQERIAHTLKTGKTLRN